jgi:hypothetical protein
MYELREIEIRHATWRQMMFTCWQACVDRERHFPPCAHGAGRTQQAQDGLQEQGWSIGPGSIIRAFLGVFSVFSI